MSLSCEELPNVHELGKQIFGLEQTPIIFEDNEATIKLAITKESQTLRHLQGD